MIHAATYKFDTYLPSGPQFKLAFDSDFIFNSRADLDNSIHCPTSHETNSTVFVTVLDDTSPRQGIIIQPPINENTDPYTIQLENDDVIELMTSDIHESDPTAIPQDIPQVNMDLPHLQWIKDDAKVTMIPPGTHQLINKNKS